MAVVLDVTMDSLNVTLFSFGNDFGNDKNDDDGGSGSGSGGSEGSGSGGSGGGGGYNHLWFLNDTAYLWFLIITLTFGSFAIAVVGVTTNAINILVFYRQGLLQDSCTASLVGLSISDFLVCFLKIVSTICYMPYDVVVRIQRLGPTQAMANAEGLGALLNFHAMTFTYISGWITAYISLERMVSVMFPFHVKRIFTPKATYVIIGCIFIVSNLLYLPKNINGKCNFHDTSNASAPVIDEGMLLANVIPQEMTILFIGINDVGLRAVCLLFVIVLNTILIAKVNLSKAFRKQTSATGPNASSSNKEMVLTKMMIILSAMFVVCYFPTCLAMSALYFSFLDFFYTYTFDAIATSLETINSSFNFFIYTTMSSRFKKELRVICGRRKRSRKQPSNS